MRVVDRGLRDLQCARPADRRRSSVGGSELAQIEVVGDLLHQVFEAFDEDFAALDVAGHAEADKHLMAELVRRRDRRGVEPGQRGGKPPATDGDLCIVGLSEVAHHGVLGRARLLRVRKPGLRAEQPAAHPLPQFTGCGPAEGDEHELIEAGVTFGQVAGGKCGDCEGLAGAGAGLQHGRSGGQGATDVEGGGRGVGGGHGSGHAFSIRSAASKGSQSRRASTPNRDGSAGQPAPASPAAGGAAASAASAVPRAPDKLVLWLGRLTERRLVPVLAGLVQRSGRRAASSPRVGVGRRGPQCNREGFAHPAGVQVEQHVEMAPGLAGVQRFDDAAQRPAASASHRDGAVGATGLRGGQRHETRPGAEAVLGRQLGVGDGEQRVPVNPRSRCR